MRFHAMPAAARSLALAATEDDPALLGELGEAPALPGALRADAELLAARQCASST